MRPRVYAAVRDGLARPLLRLLYRVEVVNGELVPPSGPGILAANHEAVLDPLVLALVTRRRIRFFAKERLWGYPLLPRLLEPLGGVPVRRGRRVLEAVAEGERLLRAGELLGVFPQGRIQRDGGRWQHGAARLALDTGAPIVPVRLVGTADALRRGHVGLPRIRAIVGEPIEVEPERPTVRLERRLTDELERAVRALEE